MNKKIEEERAVKDQIYDERDSVFSSADELRTNYDILQSDYNRLESMLKYLRREIKMKTLTAESFELLEERMILNATFLDSTDQELDRVSMEAQRLKIALEEETSLRARLQDEKKKLSTEISKSKHEMEKEIIELKKQLQDTKKVKMESDRLLLQSQAKQGELVDEISLLKSRFSGDDGTKSPVKLSPQRNRKKIVLSKEVQLQTNMTCDQMDAEAIFNKHNEEEIVRLKATIYDLQAEVKQLEKSATEAQARYETEMKARLAIKNGMDSLKSTIQIQKEEVNSEKYAF